jgi:hypothetical protein
MTKTKITMSALIVALCTPAAARADSILCGGAESA